MPIQFSDATFTQGIQHTHLQQSDGVNDIVDALGGGVCSGDINNDFLPDLVFPSGGGATRHYGRTAFWNHSSSVVVYLNRRGHFDDVTDTSGIVTNANTMGCVLADFDNDGWRDLLLTANGPLQLFRNRGDGTFEPVALPASLQSNQWRLNAAVADINSDGLLDIYLTHYLRYEKGRKYFEMASGFTEQQRFGFDPTAFDGEYDMLLLNQGKMQFTDITEKTGLRGNADRSLSALWIDHNNDNKLDLLIMSDRGTPSRLFLQKSALSFNENSSSLLPFRMDGALHAALLLPSRDGTLPLIISRSPGEGSLFLPDIRDNATPQDQSWERGINTLATSHLQRWGLVAADFNGDGKTDLFQAAGIARADSYSPYHSTPQPNLLLTAQDSGFVASELTTSMQRSTESSRGAVALDYDMDGLPDLVIANNNDAPQLLHNDSQSPRYWLGLALPTGGQWANARIIVQQGEDRVEQVNRITPTFLGGADIPLLISLDNATPVSITLQDQAGRSLHHNEILPNHYYTLDHNRSWRALEFPDAPPTPLQDLIFADTTNNIPLYLRYLSRAGHTVEQLANLNNLRVQSRLHGHAAEFMDSVLGLPTHPLFLADYIEALQTNDAGFKRRAIAKLRQLEAEVSVNVLLPRITAPREDELCDIASTFAHWFREEESVTRSKSLAIPYLIRALNTAPSAQAPCIAHALGESEHVTAAKPLLLRLQTENDVNVQIALIRALGHVRQTTVIPELEAIITQSYSGAVVAEALIALQRLNYSDVATLALQYLQQNAPTTAHKIDLLGHLLIASDGTVLSSAVMKRLLDAFEPALSRMNVGTTDADPGYQVAVNHALGITTNPATLRQAVFHGLDRIRALALRELIQGNNTDADLLARLFQLPLSESIVQSLSVRSPMLQDNDIIAITRSQAGREHLLAILGSLDADSQRKTFASLNAFAQQQPLTINPDEHSQLCTGAGFQFIVEASLFTPFAPPDRATLLALASPYQVIQRDNGHLNAWWSTVAGLTVTERPAFFRCLNQLQLTKKQREQLEFSLLTDPQLSSAFKTDWALTQADYNPQAARLLQPELEVMDASFIDQLAQADMMHLPPDTSLSDGLTQKKLSPAARLALLLELSRRNHTNPNTLLMAVAP